MKSKILLVVLLLLAVFSLFLYEILAFYDGRLHLVFCDVGQGDAIFIRTPQGVDILVDGGPDERVLGCLEKHMPFWDRQIELVFLSHPHLDHFGGLIPVLRRYKIASFNTEGVSSDSQSFRMLSSLLSKKKVSQRNLVAGDRFVVGNELVISVLWPSREYLQGLPQSSDTASSLDKNSFSLVQLIKFKNHTILLTGDIQSDILNNSLRQLSNTSIEVLKIPHHGSKTGVDEDTFNIAKPGFAVISVGKKNRYGHPAPDVLSLLSKFHIPYKRTDFDGEVEIVMK
jgi:competence protein ComEC